MFRRTSGTTRRGLNVFVVLASLLALLMANAAPIAAGPLDTPPAPTGLTDQLQRREERQQELLREHSDASGTVRPDLWQKGVQQIKQMQVVAGVPVNSASDSGLGASSLVGVQWTQVGPAPLRIDAEQNYQGAGPDSGEVVDIAIDPRNASDQTLYIATNDGGVWKSTNAGATWSPKTDFMPSLSMGALALDPANPSIVYAGTGNLFDGGGVFSKGVGIYKSIDAGDTWSVVGGAVFNNVGINRMVMPTANVLMVATNQGLFRSIDGGLNFGNNSPSFNNGLPIRGGYITDLDLDSANPATIYASVNGSGIFVSTDSGATFPTNLFGPANGGPPSGYSFIAFSQSTQPNNQTLYALVQDAARSAQLYKSIDSGANWTNPPDAAARAAENGGCQCGYDQTIGVDPQNANQVYIGFQELYRSTDGGNSFVTPPISRNKIHWDHHAMVFSPSTHWGGGGAPTRLYAGTDGGISTSADGANAFANINETIATNIFLGIDIGRGSAANNVYTYGGTQDTGTVEHRPAFPGTDWHLGIDGDGGPATVDPGNPLRAYGTDNGGFILTSDAGATWDSSGHGLPGGVSGTLVDPNNSAVVYVASGAQLFQSTDTAGTFTSIKTFPAGISRMGMVQIDSNTLWVGLSNGTVQVTGNASAGASATWTSHAVTGAPSGQSITGLAIDPLNTTQVVVVYPGFSGINPINRTRHVFRTADNGVTWTDISGTDGAGPSQNLPDLPLHSVVIDPNVSPHAIIVASDAAVMRSANGGASWQVFGVGLPTVDSKSLALDSSANPSLLRIGTYGRSTFELTSSSGPLLAVNTNLAFGTVSVGSSATSVVQMFNVGSADLHISSFVRSSGSTDFQIISGPTTPVVIPAGGEVDFTIRFQPTTAGNQTATFQINSDDPFQPAFTIAASGTGGAPQIAVSGSLNFGTVARGTSATRPVTVQNTGTGPLTVSSVAFLGGSDPAFSVLPNPGTPQTIQPTDSVIFTVQFAPPANSPAGTRTGTLRIASNDPIQPSVTLAVTGDVGVPQGVVANTALDFGSLAVDDRTIPNTSDQVLRFANQASCSLCDLTLNGLPITGPNAGDFSLVGPPTLPVVIGAGSFLDLTIRFNPSDGGARNAMLTVSTNDPANPSVVVTLAGRGLLPAITVNPSSLVFGPTVYDPVCSGPCGQTLGETITDSGQAELILDQLTFSGSSAFAGPGPASPPTRVLPTQSFVEGVTFHPTGGSSRKVTGNLHIADLMGPTPTASPVTADVPLCGESVGRGIRVLVYDNTGQIVPVVSKLQLQSHGTTIPINVNLKNLPLQTIDPPTSCQRIQFHYENQNLPATNNTVPRGSYYTLSATVGSRHTTVTFNLAVNEFKTVIVTVQ